MSSSMKWTVALVWMLHATGVVFADIGTAFSYQGSLERGGNSVTDTCNFVFRLWNDPDAGTQQGNSPQTLPAVQVNGGVFTVGSPDLDFGSGAFDGSARWMSIEVQCTGDVAYVPLTPRVELTPAPHALRAAGLVLPYVESVSIADPLLELTQTGDGPAATFDVGPNHLVGVPAVQVTNNGLGPAAILEKVGAVDYFHPTLEVRSDTGGPAAKVWVQPQPEPPSPIIALEVINETDGPAATFGVDPEFMPAAAIKATNSGLGSAIEAVSGYVGPPDLPTFKATNVGVGTGLEVSSGELSVSSAPTLRVTNIGVGTAAYLSAANGTALHAVSAGPTSTAAYFEGDMTSTGSLTCASVAWGTSALGDDQGGAIELGNSLTLGNNPYIDFHRGVGLAQDFNVRLQNDADGRLSVDGDLRVTGTLALEQELTVSGDLAVEQELTVFGDVTVGTNITLASTGDLTVGSGITLAAGSGNVTLSTGGLTIATGDLALDNGDLTLSGHLVASSSDSTATISVTNLGTGPAVHVVGALTKAYTTGTSNQATPVAYATVDVDTVGVTAVVGTPNVSSVTWESGNQRFVIAIAGESFSSTSHMTIVTPIATASPEALFATTSTGSSQLRVRIMSASTATTGLLRRFQFIVYKP